MKIKRILALMLILLIVLGTASCGQAKSHDIPEYILELDISDYDDFNILQLTDIHVANKDDRARQYRFLDKLITKADPDMIVITGDLFTFADRTVMTELFDFIDSYGLPWTCTFGNHDEQCYFSIDYLTEYLNNYGSHCLFKDIQDDDVFGNSNFAIDLTKDGELFEQLILMDSNRYNFGEYIGYDYIKDDQIEWYEDLIDYTTAENGGVAESLMFFHIPLPEWNDAWEAYEKGDPDAEYLYGVKNEDTCSPEHNSGLFDSVLEKGSTKLIAVGHDHLNNFIIRYKGVYLAYGVNTTDRIYFTEELLGGRLITLKNDHSLEFSDVLLPYSDYDEGGMTK